MLLRAGLNAPVRDWNYDDMIDVDQDAIELRVDDIAQLFHTLDPFPFRDRDLDREAEEYIVGWARELPLTQSIKLVIHFPRTESQMHAATELSQAFGRERAGIIQRDLKELFRVGRRSLGIGVSILVVCLLSAHFANGYLINTAFDRLVEESFLILGWVANWRPSEIFCMIGGRSRVAVIFIAG